METTRKRIEPIVLKNIQIPYNTDRWQPRNFSGKERGNVNREGDRNFCVFLDPEQVDCEQLILDGWNIKKSVNENDPQAEPSYMLRVKVKFHPIGSDLARLNPKIKVLTKNGEMMMDEENVGDLDGAQILKASMMISGTWRESHVYTGVVAYLKSLAVRVFEDEGSLDELTEGLMDD